MPKAKKSVRKAATKIPVNKPVKKSSLYDAREATKHAFSLYDWAGRVAEHPSFQDPKEQGFLEAISRLSFALYTSKLDAARLERESRSKRKLPTKQRTKRVLRTKKNI